ncbi:MAG: RnfABCDGE type electron transport complex subunit A [Saprospiraceae bacterium]|nr:RnfABCDGE type electron transport complex subunit A [Saprospiraceae bacterium]MBK9568081.1 RnfABCDGE type electron transport complex subunit A [Saprospiraceae bacterium]
MNNESLMTIFINACLINNFVLSFFLGICPFLGVSGKVETASKMGAAVTFVMVISSVCAYGINVLLAAINAPFLQLISYIVVIASTVQLVEMFVKKASPALFKALGIFLPLITTNCAVLAIALLQTSKGYDLLQSVTFALGGGSGFTLALVLMAGLREQLDFSEISGIAKGTALVLLVGGILSLSFMGFAGLGG